MYDGLETPDPEKENLSDAEYTDLEYDEKFKLYEQITPEKYRSWRNDVNKAHLTTKKQLNHYKHSADLLKALDERLKDDPEGRAYLDSKLMMSKTPYNRVLRKNIHRDGHRAGEEYQKWIQRMATDDQGEEFKIVLDSFS